MRYGLACLTVLFIFAGVVAAESQRQLTADSVAALIEQLGSPEFDAREQATAALSKADAKWIDTLEAHAAKTADEETKLRIEKVVQLMQVREAPGGGIVNGIKMVLMVDTTTIRPNETVKITTALMNTTDKPIQVQVGYSPTGNYFETGSALRRVVRTTNANDPTKLDTKLESAQWLMFVCGTGAQPIFTTIQPGEALIYTCPMKYVVNPPAEGRVARAGQQPGKPNALMLSDDGWSQFATNGDETFALKVVHKVSAGSNRVPDWGGPPKPDAPPAKPQDTNDKWTGDVASNIVTVHVKPEEPATDK